MLPGRYLQWSCTTPTILFTLSKISDFSSRRIALVMLSDWTMIFTGYLSAMYPPGFISSEQGRGSERELQKRKFIWEEIGVGWGWVE
jgi:hypothetical protein